MVFSKNHFQLTMGTFWRPPPPSGTCPLMSRYSSRIAAWEYCGEPSTYGCEKGYCEDHCLSECGNCFEKKEEENRLREEEEERLVEEDRVRKEEEKKNQWLLDLEEEEKELKALDEEMSKIDFENEL